jgi:type IV pilus assembly protein PilQ
MMRGIPKKSSVWLMSVLFLAGMAYAQSAPVAGPPPEKEAQAEIKNSLSAAENVTLDFKDADIHNVLKILAKKANVNIVTTPEVIGTITIKLVDVPWDRAMDVILKSNGFGYQKQGNVVLVTKLENMSKIQADEPLRTEIINLHFLDAQDAQRIIIPMLTARGKISILYARGQKGWKFGSFKIGKEQVASGMQERESGDAAHQETVAIVKGADGNAVASKVEYEPSIKSKTLIVTDTDANIDRIINMLPLVDRRPKQVIIEARIMEVNREKLKDIGFDYGTGTNGATATAINALTFQKATDGTVQSTLGGNLLSSQVTPSTFAPQADIKGTAATYNTGLNLLFNKLTGTQFQVLVHALEEDVQANTLSAPRIVTLDNQEASMLVGYHTPIL